MKQHRHLGSPISSQKIKEIFEFPEIDRIDHFWIHRCSKSEL